MKVVKWLLLLAPLFLLMGCYDKTELEEQSYVIAIGLDKAKKEGDFKITFQIGNPEVGSQVGASSKEPSRETDTLTASDFLSAKNTANAFISRQISLKHTKVIAISEELARSDDFLRAMQSTTRERELRRETHVVIVKGKASEFLHKNKSLMETRPHKYYQFMINRAQETGLIPPSDIHRFFNITEGDADLFLGMLATIQREKQEKENGKEDNYTAGQIEQEGGNPAQFIGAAVFKNGKMIDTLTGEEVRICLLLDNTLEMSDLMATYPDPVMPEYDISARLIKVRNTKVNVNYHKDKPTEINVVLPLEAEILAIPSLYNYSDKPKDKEFLRHSIEKDLEKKINKFIKKTQEVYKAEPFYWSLYVRKYFLTIDQYEQADWNKKIYPNAKITVKVDLTNIKFGKQIRDLNLQNVRD